MTTRPNKICSREMGFLRDKAICFEKNPSYLAEATWQSPAVFLRFSCNLRCTISCWGRQYALRQACCANLWQCHAHSAWQPPAPTRKTQAGCAATSLKADPRSATQSGSSLEHSESWSDLHVKEKKREKEKEKKGRKKGSKYNPTLLLLSLKIITTKQEN